jgi:hypothetical protein
MKMRMGKRYFGLGKLSLICLLALSFLIPACGGKNNSSDSSGLSVFSSDDTDKAIQVVTEANDELKKIKAIYKENEGSVDEVQAAMAAKDNAKVKSIADNLVFRINDGITLGENAISKLEEAEKLNINDTFRQYLELKRSSLRKQVDAFEYRRQAAELLSKGFSGNDPKQIDGIKLVFKEKETDFQKVWQEGRDESQEANDFYKENFKKKAQ